MTCVAPMFYIAGQVTVCFAGLLHLIFELFFIEEPILLGDQMDKEAASTSEKHDAA